MNKINYGLLANQESSCALSCLKNERINGLSNDDNFNCMSFDVCEQKSSGNTLIQCAFTNNSVSTNKNFLSENGIECTHYSSKQIKIVLIIIIKYFLLNFKN